MRAEEAKPAMPGAGLCPGFTISRAILSDAVCLTRVRLLVPSRLPRSHIEYIGRSIFDRRLYA
jgi:hypothetical protein